MQTLHVPTQGRVRNDDATFWTLEFLGHLPDSAQQLRISNVVAFLPSLFPRLDVMDLPGSPFGSFGVFLAKPVAVRWQEGALAGKRLLFEGDADWAW
jgi:hypothetical protein